LLHSGRIVVRNSTARAGHFGFGGAMLLDLPGPALRLLTDVADFHFSDIAVRGDDGARAIGARRHACWNLCWRERRRRRRALTILFAIPRARGGAERRAESGPSFGPRRRPISF
jgi:hypothetical protein